MFDHCHRSVSFGAFALTCLALAACSNLSGTGDKMARVVTPYKMDVIQGNVVTREQLAVLKPGMQRIQVRDILGSALLASVFHADRWDYVFTLERPGAQPQARRVTVFFKGDVLERIEADDLPSESEFVSTLKSEAKSGPLPALEASEEGLKKFPAPNRPAPAPSAASPASTNYPPLEPAGK
ncbi:MAG: cell envelope protein SmpA [Burkholderiales bacterium RIFCSPLOWO2_12_FULL_61_40]|nr:MAG: cell envelope protein SmpA [Burkholderiales bacterium RIFCSPLOWO2_12_FULL_61_40]